ncbi:hypothetical protein PROFUN_00244 [Planoprotostelium fungivorum]|uniref:Uncharacterized protein n=1 Tax=Planoprotostelium fungivorum TaxID=1890364 RepID=A0A2P6NXV9_9EUKA|nr:hypothetical protein PROFUN_00244 [Planoprotostelium fungivorum]
MDELLDIKETDKVTPEPGFSENSATKKHIQCMFIEKEHLGFLWFEIILYKQRLIELFGSYVFLHFLLDVVTRAVLALKSATRSRLLDSGLLQAPTTFHFKKTKTADLQITDLETQQDKTFTCLNGVSTKGGG